MVHFWSGLDRIPGLKRSKNQSNRFFLDTRPPGAPQSWSELPPLAGKTSPRAFGPIVHLFPAYRCSFGLLQNVQTLDGSLSGSPFRVPVAEGHFSYFQQKKK